MKTHHLVLILILLSSFAGVSSQTCAIPDPGIIAWWSFDDITSTLIEDIAQNDDGIVVNGNSHSPEMVSNAITFDSLDETIQTVNFCYLVTVRYTEIVIDNNPSSRDFSIQLS